MDRVFYDQPDFERINAFLNRLIKIKAVDGNPTLSMYEELEKDGLKRRDIGRKGKILQTKDNTNTWMPMTSDGTIRMMRNNTQAFTFFTKGEIPAEVLIKLYIPLDKKHVAKGSKMIFEYIKSLGIEHESKVADDVRNDNVVVRLRKKDVRYAMDIINFVTTNKYLSKGLNKTNPFVPTINGIGYIEEVGIEYSYNTCLEKYLDNYIYMCWAREKKPSAMGLIEFLKDPSQNCPKEVVNTFERFIRGNNYVSLVNNEELENRIKQLFSMYGIKGLERMSFLVDSNEKIFYLESILSNYYNRRIFFNNKNDLIRQYIYMIYGESLAETIKYVCVTTLENYDMEQLVGAIKKYIVNEDAESFSSFNKDESGFNCREYMKLLDKDILVYIMRYTLIENGVDANSMNISDLVGSYTSYISGLWKGPSI